MNLQETIRRILREDKKTKSTNKEFSKYKNSKFNTLRDYTLQDIVDNWDSLSDHKNENIKTIKHFINNPDKITDLVYDEKGLEDGYHRLIAAKILKKPRFSYRLVDNLQESIRRILREDKLYVTPQELVKNLPRELKELLFKQWGAKQNPEWHPEGNTLKHILVVIRRAYHHYPDDPNMIMAALFHDLGKIDTYKINPKTGQPTAYGHEDKSTDYVEQFREWIESFEGTDVDEIKYLVKNHMKVKPSTWDQMKDKKKEPIKSHPAFDKLMGFTDKLDGGGTDLKESIRRIIREESLMKPRLNKLLNILFRGFDDIYYDWANYNCGMGECCDPYAIGFVLPKSHYDEYLFKLVDDDNWEPNGDNYPDEVRAELPEVCYEQPDIKNPDFSTIVFYEENAEEIENFLGPQENWDFDLLDLINNRMKNQKFLPIRAYLKLFGQFYLL